MVTSLPTNVKAAPTLKYAATEVIVPSLGIENATLFNPVVLISPPTITAVSLAPNPISAWVPANPPKTVVSVVSGPEANGMIAPAPVGPVGPIAPSAPVGPVGYRLKRFYFPT